MKKERRLVQALRKEDVQAGERYRFDSGRVYQATEQGPLGGAQGVEAGATGSAGGGGSNHGWTPMNTDNANTQSPHCRVDASPCPVCNAKLDAATCASQAGRSPRPGDITVCLYCATILVFNPDLSHREADVNDLMELQKDTANWKLLTRLQNKIKEERAR